MSSTIFLLHTLTTALTGFVLAATALAILFQHRPLLGVSQHWGLQLWWLALLGALPALWLRDWIAFGLCLAVAVYWSLRLFKARPNGMARGETPLFRIVSANLLHANRDFGRALRMIAALDADLVVLCETTPEARTAFQALEARFPHALDTCMPDGLYGIVILSRFPLTERSRGIGEDQLPRHLAADLDIPGFDTPAFGVPAFDTTGGRISLVAIHPTNPLRLPRAHRIPAEFDAVAELCRSAGDDLVLIGDCNAAGWSSWLRRLEQVAGLANDGGLRPSWPVWLPLPLRLPLDHVWVRGRLTLCRTRLGPRSGSDHLPLIAEIGKLER